MQYIVLPEYPQVKKTYDVVIEKMVAGALGLARLSDGRVVFVANTLPGEEVRLRLLAGGKAKAPMARLQQVLRPSASRVSPSCPYHARCGGCQLQHCADDEQAVLKKAMFVEQLERSSLSFAAENIDFYAAPQPLRYRQRIRLQVQDGEVGYFQAKTHTFLAIEQCLLACGEINDLLDALLGHEVWSFVGELTTQLELHLDASSGLVVIRLHYNRKVIPRDVQLFAALVADLAGLKTLLVIDPHGRVSGPFPADIDPFLHFQLPLSDFESIDFTLEAGGFCQVNQQQNEVMVRQLLAWLGSGDGRRVLDLFCGMGNFSLALARADFEVLGVDQQRAGIRQAQRNSRENSLSCDFLRQGTAQALEHFTETQERFDVILLDPPRAGIKEEAAAIAAMGVKQVIYISCDPATLLRDLQVMVKFYSITAISLVDMFPQTAHVESMVLLERL